MRGLFITGTDTEVGKTYVTALMALALARQGHRVGVYKPVASGCVLQNNELVSEDALQLWEAAGKPLTLNDVCPQRFAAPLAPPTAAKAEGRQVDSQQLRKGLTAWLDACDIVLVEGAGGLMSPLSDEDYNADLAADLGFPLIVVAPNKLGTINGTLQTLITATAWKEGLPTAGVVLNDVLDLSQATSDESLATNAEEIRLRSGPPLLNHVRHGSGLTSNTDWFALATDYDLRR